MARPTTLRFGAAELWLSDAGSSPDQLIKICGLNEMSLEVAKETNDVTVPDCDDPDAPSWTQRDVVALAWTMSGSGILAQESLSLIEDITWQSNASDVRLVLVGGGDILGEDRYYQGRGHAAFNISGSRGEKIQIEVSIEGDGELVIVGSSAVTVPVDVTAPTITSSSAFSNSEALQLSHILTANESVTWSLIGGADLAQFQLTGNELQWVADGFQDYESPVDAGANNTYVVQVRATDGSGNTADQTITVTVTDVDEINPTITSSASISVDEDAQLSHALTADEAVTWSIVGGADQAQFQITGSELQWSSDGTRDFDAPADADVNNAYLVQVRATDGASNFSNQNITVTVTQVVAGAALMLDLSTPAAEAWAII